MGQLEERRLRWEARILWAGNSNHADRELTPPRLCVKLQSGIRYTCARAVQLFSLFVWLTFPGRVHMTCTLSVRGFGRCATHRGTNHEVTHLLRRGGIHRPCHRLPQRRHLANPTPLVAHGIAPNAPRRPWCSSSAAQRRAARRCECCHHQNGQAAQRWTSSLW